MPKPGDASSVCLQRWQGTVIERDDKSFQARLVDLTGNEADEIAEISCNDVQAADLNRVIPGAVFLLATGYATSTSGQRTRQTELIFTDLPVWRERDIESARQRGRDMKERFAARSR